MMKINRQHISFLAVSASRKQKYHDREYLNGDIASNYDNYDNASIKLAIASMGTSLDSTFTDFEQNGAENSVASNTGHIKRYKMERKNSQQSQHGKQELFAQGGSTKSSIQLEFDASLTEYIGEKEIRVKIADLGNACYNVSLISIYQTKFCRYIMQQKIIQRNTLVIIVRTIILPKIFKHDNIVRSK